MKRVSITVLAALALAACGSGVSTGPTTGATSLPPASSTTPTGGGSTQTGGGSANIMPNLVGQSLDTAESTLSGQGIQSPTIQSTNGEEVIVPFDWGVCSTTPPAGSPISGGNVVLTVGHFTCGAGG